MTTFGDTANAGSSHCVSLLSHRIVKHLYALVLLRYHLHGGSSKKTVHIQCAALSSFNSTDPNRRRKRRSTWMPRARCRASLELKIVQATSRTGQLKQEWQIEVGKVTTAHSGHARIFAKNPTPLQQASGGSSATNNDAVISSIVRILESDPSNSFRQQYAEIAKVILSRENEFHRLHQVCTTIIDTIYSVPHAQVDSYLQPFLQFLQSNISAFQLPPTVAHRSSHELRSTLLEVCAKALFETIVSSASVDTDTLYIRLKNYYATKLVRNDSSGQTPSKRPRQSLTS